MNQLFANLPTLMAAPGADASGSASIVPTLITFGLVFVIFYFLIIRPQNKQKKETQKMLDAIKKGDKVVTIGGIHGTVQSVKESEVVLKIDANTKMTFNRSAISSIRDATKPSKKANAEEKAEAEPQEESSTETETDADET